MDKKYIEAIKFVSQEFWGEPTLKNDDEWRFGNKLSKAVNLKERRRFIAKKVIEENKYCY